MNHDPVDRLGDAFAPTPHAFHARLMRQLDALESAPGKAPRAAFRPALALALMLALLCSTALAVHHFGVQFFLTERVAAPKPFDASAVAQPIHQACDSEYLLACVQDAYWDGETLALSVQLSPKGDFAFYIETDRGQDGQSFDKIWRQGEVMDFDAWKAGRPSLMLRLPRLIPAGAERSIVSAWDWVQEAQGETMLIEAACEDMTRGGDFLLALPCTLEDSGETETAQLAFSLPPMKKGAIRP